MVCTVVVDRHFCHFRVDRLAFHKVVRTFEPVAAGPATTWSVGYVDKNIDDDLVTLSPLLAAATLMAS